MGVDYSYWIYVPAGNVMRALQALVEQAPPARRAPVELTLPGGERLVVPFTSRFKSDPVDCSASGSTSTRA